MSLLDQHGYLTLAAFVIFLNYVIYASVLYQQVRKYIWLDTSGSHLDHTLINFLITARMCQPCTYNTLGQI